MKNDNMGKRLDRFADTHIVKVELTLNELAAVSACCDQMLATAPESEKNHAAFIELASAVKKLDDAGENGIDIFIYIVIIITFLVEIHIIYLLHFIVNW